MNWHVLFPPKLGVIVVSLQNDQNVRQMDHTLGGLTERVPPVHCTPPPAASSSITRERSCHTFCSLPHPQKYVNIPSGKYIYVHKYVYICVYTYVCKMDENRSYAGLT